MRVRKSNNEGDLQNEYKMTRQLFDPDHNRLSMSTELSADPPEYCPSCGQEIKYVGTQGGTLRRLRCTCHNLEDMAKHSSNPVIRRLFR